MTQSSQAPFTLAMEALLELVPGHLYCKDKDGKYLWCNKNQLLTLGLLSLDDIVGKTDAEVTSPETGRLLRENDMRIMEVGKLEIMEEHCKFGTQESCLSYKAPLLDSNRVTIGVIGNSIDNFKQKTIHISVRDSRDKLLSMLSQFMDVSQLK